MRGTQVIFENDEDRRAFLQFGFIRPADGYLIPGVGVDTSRFVPIPESEVVPIVLLAARMLWDKGVGEFVEAARLLHAEGLKARFVLVGRTDAGNPASISDKQIETWHDEGVIEWWGWGEDMPVVLSMASVVCLPSYYREGLPTVLMEASACGRPAVTTDWPGCRDAIIDGVTGLLVKVRDVLSLADALRKLIIDPALRRKMGTAGRSVAEKQFSTEKITTQILAVYKKVLERSLE
jgi:glycosyltransferase involved in cell wall biosynthesis